MIINDILGILSNISLECTYLPYFPFRGMSSDDATKDVIENQIPEVVRLNENGELSVENIDVFCEKGVFNLEQTRQILKSGKAQGKWRINFHGEELNRLGSAEVSDVQYSYQKRPQTEYLTI